MAHTAAARLIEDNKAIFEQYSQANKQNDQKLRDAKNIE